MALFESGNPALSEKKFRSSVLSEFEYSENSMTVKGTLNKFALLFVATLTSAYFTWKEFANGGNVFPYIIVGVFGGLGVAIFISFKKEWSQYLAPVYALLEGLVLGGVSAYFEYSAQSAQGMYTGGYSGIVIQAIGLTFATVISMYMLYKFRVIRATEKFKSVIFVATAAIGIFYLSLWILSFFNVPTPGFIYEGSAFGIGFSVFVVALAALNLILDFDRIEQGAAMNAPKYMEWYGAFGLLVTIVWLYMEILRLLSKLNRD